MKTTLEIFIVLKVSAKLGSTSTLIELHLTTAIGAL